MKEAGRVRQNRIPNNPIPEATAVPEATIPEATVARLPIYRRVLADLSDNGLTTSDAINGEQKKQVTTISSEELAAMSGVNAAQVRKDISYLGSLGTPGVGYKIEELSAVVSRGLGLSQDWPVVIAGIGNLGAALANYLGFGERGFPVTALIDSDPKKIGQLCAGLVIHPLDELHNLVNDNGIAVGVITVPASGAQKVADSMVENGIRSILNFAPVLVNVPEGINLRQVDLSVELEVLSFYLERQTVATNHNPASPSQ